MIVYFLRHANAGEPKADPAKDEKRPLDDDGIAQCGHVGRALAAMDVHVDLMISSPLKRATQTASLVSNEIGYEGKLQLDDALRPSASFRDFRDLLTRSEKYESIMVVGHNPNLSEFLGRLISSGSAEAFIDLKKGAVAKVEVGRRNGELHWCVTPKLLRTIYESLAASSLPKTARK